MYNVDVRVAIIKSWSARQTGDLCLWRKLPFGCLPHTPSALFLHIQSINTLVAGAMKVQLVVVCLLAAAAAANGKLTVAHV